MNKILIANRGEIACRVMRTARQMGIETVAVYSDADRHAPHVLMADEAVHLGASPASESYLDIKKVIAAAIKTRADAIHPGYGFLSENATFARAVEEAGLIFIGPSAHSIEVMGSKLAAKEAVKAYDIPLVPGTDQAIQTPQEALRIAREVGYPLLIKASAGGGGKGMRVVSAEEELESQMNRAISEAQNAFGDGAVFIERYVSNPRHIEIQILADQHGKTVHLYERECSIQRRHQKVIEEAPSSCLTPEVRAQMGDAAVRVAQACGYVGAGTVEFLVDQDLNYYFLEMNTRLQVEHPVTECITGLDLVEQQIRIARGEPLAVEQKDIPLEGHALELRVYAEDPLNQFLPSTGFLHTYRPASGPGIRVDDGYREEMEVPVYYDPLLSKLIVYAPDRKASIQKMLTAIQNFQVEGVATTLSFGRFVLEHDAFRSGQFDTGFVNTYFDAEALNKSDEAVAHLAARLALRLLQESKKELRVPDPLPSNWTRNRS